MSRNLYAAAVIGVVALVTFLTRVIPFLFFGGKRTAPGPVRYLGGFCLRLSWRCWWSI